MGTRARVQDLIRSLQLTAIIGVTDINSRGFLRRAVCDLLREFSRNESLQLTALSDSPDR